MSQSAFVLRISPGGVDKVPEAFRSGELIAGWAEADGLLEPNLSWESFRDIVRRAYYADQPDLRKAGGAAGHLWRFIREMKPGDLMVVPYGAEFFVAEVSGPATYDRAKVNEDSAYRRAVRWLNGEKPISRRLAKSALLSRMKTQGTCADATDLLDEIKECLSLAQGGQAPTFQTDLQARLIREVLTELRSGRIDNRGFERLIQTVLRGLGAEEVRIVPRSQDEGADLLVRDPEHPERGFRRKPNAQTGPIRTRIPEDSERRFRTKSNAVSGRIRTRIPGQSERSFRRKANAPGTGSGGEAGGLTGRWTAAGIGA